MTSTACGSNGNYNKDENDWIEGHPSNSYVNGSSKSNKCSRICHKCDYQDYCSVAEY